MPPRRCGLNFRHGWGLIWGPWLLLAYQNQQTLHRLVRIWRRRFGLCSEGLRRSIAQGNSPNADMATSKALYQKAW